MLTLQFLLARLVRRLPGGSLVLSLLLLLQPRSFSVLLGLLLLLLLQMLTLEHRIRNGRRWRGRWVWQLAWMYCIRYGLNDGRGRRSGCPVKVGPFGRPGCGTLGRTRRCSRRGSFGGRGGPFGWRSGPRLHHSRGRRQFDGRRRGRTFRHLTNLVDRERLATVALDGLLSTLKIRRRTGRLGAPPNFERR